MKIRVHFIITSLSPQGAQHVLLRLLERIDRERFEPTVICLTGSAPMAERFRQLGVPVHLLGLRASLSAFAALVRLVRMLRDDAPHVVQTWMYHADLIGGLAARLAGRAAVVWNIRHGNLDPGVNRRHTLLTVKACALLSRRLPDRIVCCAEAARQTHVAWGYAADKMLVIPNGFDLETFRPAPRDGAAVRDELGIPAQELVVGLVGRFHPQKDHRNFIQAAAHFARSYPDAHYVLAGDDIDHDNHELTAWIDTAGITARTHLLGRRSDVVRLMAAFDIATSSSLGEGFPNVVGEAMACAIPCVVTDVGDSASLVGDTGLVVPPGDPSALARAWAQLAELGHAGRLELGARARQRIIEQFSIDAVVERYQQLYSGLCPAVLNVSTTTTVSSH